MSTIQQPDGSLCPHYLDIDEELLSELSSKVAKIRSENKELFDFTHHRITVFDALADQERQVSEEEIYAEFKQHHSGNFVTIIEGNVGTGKSELCAYLSHQLQDDGRPVLHIDKNADLLSIMAEEIPQFYKEEIGGELRGSSNVQKLQRHIQNNRETVASLVVSKAILNISDLDDTTVDLSGDQRGKLEEFVQQKLTAINERGELATKVSFVDPGEINSFSYLNVFDEKSLDNAAEAWNDAIWQAVRDEYNSPSLDQLLKRVGQEFGEDRPVLVFEDFSISSLDAEKLRDYMEDDGSENNWDFIIGGTQDSTEVLHTQTGRERHNFYRTNRPNSNSVLFLDETSCVDFIRPYLGYIKEGDGSVSYTRDDNNAIVEINPAKSDSRCSNCGFCDPSFRDLFPFNEVFLRQIYLSLDKDDQRPRQYVQKVFNVLEDYLHEIVRSPASSDELSGLNNPRTVHNDIYDNEGIRRLAKWYGETRESDDDDDRLVVDIRFPKAFGLDEVDIDELHIKQETESHAAGGSREVWTIPTTGGDIGGGGGSSGGGGGGTITTVSQEEKKINEIKGYLDTWRDNPDASAAASLDVYMKRGLKDALDELTEGFVLQSDGSLEYFVGGNDEPFVLEGQGAPERDQIQIDPADFVTSDLLELLKYGVYREMDPSNAEEAELFGAMGTQLTGYAREWRDFVRGAYLDSSPNFFVNSARRKTFEDLVIGLYGVAVLLDNPWKPVTAERIAEAYQSDELGLDKHLEGALRDRLVQDKQDEISEFMKGTEYMEALVGDYFAASKSVLDLPRIREHLSEAPPLEVLDDLKKGGLKDLPAKLRFGSDMNLRDLGLAGYAVSDALDDVSGDEGARDAASFVNHQLRGIDLEKTETYIESIRTYDDVSPDVKEALGKFAAYSEKELEKVLSACELHQSLREQGDTHASIHATLAGLKVWEHNLTGILAGIEFSDDSDGNDMSEFVELSDHYTRLE